MPRVVAVPQRLALLDLRQLVLGMKLLHGNHAIGEVAGLTEPVDVGISGPTSAMQRPSDPPRDRQTPPLPLSDPPRRRSNR